MSFTALVDFLRRELAPQPGRGSATFRLTLACLAVTIPVFTHHVPTAVIVMIVLYKVASVDTSETLKVSIAAGLGFTIALTYVLLVWELCLDIPWLRLCFLVATIFVGLFLTRALTIGALGAAIGIPAATVMVFPDTMPPNPEGFVKTLLWIWVTVIFGLAVNAGVQLLFAYRDPLTLLRREMDKRLLAVEKALRHLAGGVATEPPSASLNALSAAGMSRPLSLLNAASKSYGWTIDRHDGLAAIITLTDRLVTAAVALDAVAPLSGGMRRERLLNIADSCNHTRLAFQQQRLPSPHGWTAPETAETSATMSLLTDMESTLDQIALAEPAGFRDHGDSGGAPAKKRALFLPDAFDNHEYVQFAVKGTLAALICYFCFIGFDYPGISTSMTTCLVLSLSTVGASFQKGSLRFGGAIVGGLLSIFSLVYLFPMVQTIGGYWLIFAAGTAVAAWVNFGGPRISYLGYQIALIFYIAVLHPSPSPNLTVIRDRMIGVTFGFLMFSAVEYLLWPVLASDMLRLRLSEILHLLAELARPGADQKTQTVTSTDVDLWRRRISQKVMDAQELIESSKFESSPLNLQEIQERTGDAQIILLLLLALARQRHDTTLPVMVRATEGELDNAVASTLLALEAYVKNGSPPVLPDLEAMVDALERSVSSGVHAPRETAAGPRLIERLTVYRALVAAINRLSPAMSIGTA
jgi:multidrug resistance protein MdtO